MRALTVSSRGFATLDQGRVNLAPVVGGFELGIHLPGQSIVRDDPCWVVLHAAEILVSAGSSQPRRIGTARPATPLRLLARAQQLPFTWEFKLPVTPQQLAEIEDLRNGADLTFRVALEGEGGPLNDEARRDRVTEDCWIAVASSEWVASLNGVNAADIALLEIPMPFVDPPPALKAMMEMLRRAQALFLAGQYSESVSRCRAALEALAALQDRDSNWSSVAFNPYKAGQAKDMTKSQRETAVEGAVMHLTHLGAHPNEIQIDRRDAKFAIALTASILAFNATR